MAHETGSDVARVVRQHLESLRRAGLTHLPRHAEPVPMPARAESVSAEPAAHAGERSSAADESASPVETTPSSAPSSSAAPGLFGADGTTPESESKHQPQTRSEKQQALQTLAECVAGCTRCGPLAESRKQTVFGVGNPEARIMFVGEAPGADEDRLGEPFVGKAGQLLDRIIAACKKQRDDIYICNILKCRPPGNRNPTPEEANNCREYLDAQIRIVDPEYIVCWGSVAARNLLDTTDSVGRLRGRFLLHGRAKVLCTYHPSYLLRNPAAKKPVWEDMKFLFKDMGVDLESK